MTQRRIPEESGGGGGGAGNTQKLVEPLGSLDDWGGGVAHVFDYSALGGRAGTFYIYSGETPPWSTYDYFSVSSPQIYPPDTPSLRMSQSPSPGIVYHPNIAAAVRLPTETVAMSASVKYKLADASPAWDISSPLVSNVVKSRFTLTTSETRAIVNNEWTSNFNPVFFEHYDPGNSAIGHKDADPAYVNEVSPYMQMSLYTPNGGYPEASVSVALYQRFSVLQNTASRNYMGE